MTVSNFLQIELTIQEKWFVLYDTSFLPDTAIRLGQLITDPRKPADTVQKAPLEIRQLGMTVDRHSEKDVVFQTRTDKSLGIGLSATVLSILPFGLSGDKRKDTTHLYEIKKVEVRMFNPSREYVLKSVLEPEVLNYLARHKYRKSLYMIVGIQIGFNAKIVHKRTHTKAEGLIVSNPGALTD